MIILVFIDITNFDLHDYIFGGKGGDHHNT